MTLQAKSKKTLLYLIITGVVVWLLGTVSSVIYFFKVINNSDRFTDFYYTEPSPAPLFIFGFLSSLGFLLAVVSGIIYLALYIASQRANNGQSL